MKLYQTPTGTWCGTQEQWNKAMKAEGWDTKEWSLDRCSVEVPTTPKTALMEFLTFHNVNAVNPLDLSGGDHPAPSPAATTIPGNIDEQFAAAPITQQLRLAVAAIDAADALLRP